MPMEKLIVEKKQRNKTNVLFRSNENLDSTKIV